MPDEKPTKRRARRGGGSVFQKVEGGAWHIQYYRPDPDTGRSKCIKEYIKAPNKSVAQRELNDRLAKIGRGEMFEVGRRITVGQLYDALLTHTKNSATKPRAVIGLGWRWNHLKKFFGHVPAASVTTALIEKYRSQRLEAGAAKATINHEVGMLRHMYRYGKQSTPPTVHNIPHFPMFHLDNARQGFVEQPAFDSMAEEAAKEGLWLRLYLELAFTYGWRRGELINLTVRQLNFANRTIRLHTSKNGEGREVAMSPAVEQLLRAMSHGKQPADHVFTREDGKPVKDFRGAWRNLCVRAGVGRYSCASCDENWQPVKTFGGQRCQCGSRKRKYTGLIVHDFRRSAAKAARRAGVPESVVMAMGGWKTAAMFRRYAIVSERDQRDAIQLIEQARAQQLNPLNNPPQEKLTSVGVTQEGGTIQ